MVRIDGAFYRAKEADERDEQRKAERAAKPGLTTAQGRSMSSPLPSPASPSPLAATTASHLPRHWTPEQALAVFECPQLLGQALWGS